MTCSHCAQTITKKLESSGAENVNVDFASGEASFVLHDKHKLQEIISGIHSIGYKASEKKEGHEHHHEGSNVEKKFWWSLAFTVPLFFSHMIFPHDFILNDPIVQLLLCVPVFGIGLVHFGRSAWGSVKAGSPNMDVLIMLGASAAFIYSVIGTTQHYGSHEAHNYLFYETAAVILTLVLLGNVIEHRSVKLTTSAIGELTKLQKVKAKKVMMHGSEEHIHEVEYAQVKAGDILLVNMGDKVPVDGEIVSGSASVNEAMLTGEAIPVDKKEKDKVTGGTIAVSGSFKMRAEQVGRETALSKIIDMVKRAQQSKPELQKLGDKVSAVFVPVVLVIALATFLITYFFFHFSFNECMMRAIAVLVISCPCAMGLATPTAVMVGIGRAAKQGILIKGGRTLEAFARVRTVVFDKTGTLTTGDFRIKNISAVNGTSEKELGDILYSLEQHSSHPIARSVVNELKQKAGAMKLADIKEEKGLGISATDASGNKLRAGSFRIAQEQHMDSSHNIYVLKNDQLIGTVDIEDSIKPGAREAVDFLKQENITSVLLSGDSKKKCEEVAVQTGIEKVFAEQHPAEKLQLIDNLVKEHATAMVGDGINDAPALAKASVGVSISNATQVAIQSAQIILLKEKDLSQLETAYRISRHTLITVKQNLFWAFFYNVIAIPIAAAGLLSPMIGALAMAFSDVIVVGNSIRLRSKKLS